MSLKGLEEREIVMSLSIIYRVLLIGFFLMLFGCGSSEVKPTRDICSIKKHWRDNVFQVLINDEAINKHFYTHDEALAIAKQLADDNKCMR